MTWIEREMGWLWTCHEAYGNTIPLSETCREIARIVKSEERTIRGYPNAYPYRVTVPGFLSFNAQNLDEAKRLAQAAYVGQHKEDVVEQ